MIWQLQDHFLILLASGLCIWLTSVILVCVLTPRCWMYEKMRKRQLRKTVSLELVNFHPLDPFASNPTEVVPVQSETDRNLGRIHRWNSLLKFHRNNARYSSTHSKDSGRDSIETQTVSSQSSRKGSQDSTSATENNAGYVALSLEFMEHDSQLVIYIEGAADLAARTYADTCDPCVTVLVERVRSSLRGKRRDKIAQFVTSVVAQCQHPQYQQRYTVPMQPHQIRDCHLLINISDCDKLTGTRPLGSARIYLNQYLHSVMNGKVQVVRRLSPATQVDKGEILVGVSFLHTSQRIAVNIFKARRLSAQKTDKILVRVMLLTETGRIAKRRKTKLHDFSNDLEFDETFNFFAGVDQWEKFMLLVVLCSADGESTPESTSEEANSSSTRIQQSQEDSSKLSRSDSKKSFTALGYLAFGKHVSSINQRIHWNSAMNNPRQTVSQWHAFH